MANAAAKKAAAARSAASSTYFPIVVGINVIHVLIRLYRWNDFISSSSNLMLNAILVVLTVVAYRGILDDCADSASATTAKVGSGKQGSGGVCGGGGDKLAGGASLDLLGLVVVVQFGSALVSDKFYWLLGVLPFWGGYRLYKMVYGAKEGLMPGGGGSGSGSSGGYGGGAGGADMAGGTDSAAEERRRKRAERRRMKRG